MYFYKKGESEKIVPNMGTNEGLEIVSQNQNLVLITYEMAFNFLNQAGDLTEGVNLEKLKKKYNKKVNTESQLNNLEIMDQEENLENVYQNVNFNQVSDKMVQKK